MSTTVPPYLVAGLFIDVLSNYTSISECKAKTHEASKLPHSPSPPRNPARAATKSANSFQFPIDRRFLVPEKPHERQQQRRAEQGTVTGRRKTSSGVHSRRRCRSQIELHRCSVRGETPQHEDNGKDDDFRDS
nr:hypothetical protein Iba_chr08dCG0660 [Ipomoea batatas]